MRKKPKKPPRASKSTRSAQDLRHLKGCRRGDEDAWLSVYRAYSADIGVFIRGMLHNPSDVDDLIQQVFIEFLGSLERFRGEVSLRSWLHHIARYVVSHEIRSRSRRSHYVNQFAETQQERGNDDPERQAQARDRLALIQRLLTDLDEPFREVWILREVQQFSVRETAEILDIREATVRTRHHRGRKKLLELLSTAEQPSERKHPHLKLLTSSGGKK